MTRKNSIPRFPYSYIGKKAIQYNSQKWMERNQKRATLLSLQYLFDKKLGVNDIQEDKKYLILDLGCGTGFSSDILIEYDYKVIGIDILIDMLRLASEKKKEYHYKNLELILADIKYLPIRSLSVNHVISISAYNFIINDSQSSEVKEKIMSNTAKYLNKILKKNGRIVIEFYPKNTNELEAFTKSFINNGFKGYMIKSKPNQKSGQIFILLKKIK
ncbi:MAG: class I SAM-dependent methyltransferase [Promethearchaeota archaeon]